MKCTKMTPTSFRSPSQVKSCPGCGVQAKGSSVDTFHPVRTIQAGAYETGCPALGADLPLHGDLAKAIHACLEALHDVAQRVRYEKADPEA